MNKKEHIIGDNKIFVEELIPEKEMFPHPLVLVHGSFGGFFMWKMIATALQKAGFHSYALSLRGHKPSGETDLGNISMEDYVDDITVVVNELHLEEPVVIGHSMAGLLVLMYAKGNLVHAVISIDPSPSLEVQGSGDEEKIKTIPSVYTAMDVGMPSDSQKVMQALPDIPPETLMKMKDMLGPESGHARRDRKRGISVPKESLNAPILMIGAELGKSVPFGISLESTKKMAKHYNAKLVEIKGATHPGVLMGVHAGRVSESIISWLSTKA